MKIDVDRIDWIPLPALDTVEVWGALELPKPLLLKDQAGRIHVSANVGDVFRAHDGWAADDLESAHCPVVTEAIFTHYCPLEFV